jgi:hypothetical protein
VPDGSYFALQRDSVQSVFSDRYVSYLKVIRSESHYRRRRFCQLIIIPTPGSRNRVALRPCLVATMLALHTFSPEFDEREQDHRMRVRCSEVF